MPFFALAQFAQGAPPEAGTGELDRSTDIVRLVADATLVGKIVLLILLIFSAVSWAIIFYKIWAFRRAEQQTATFLGVFRKSAKFSEVQAVCPTLSASPLVGLFQAGYAELNTQLRTDKAGDAGQAGSRRAGRPTLKSLDAVDRALLRATTVELNKLEQRVPFLATTASITPFIGLFGTVWGIVIAFQGIASAGNTSLGVVAQPHRRGADRDRGGAVRGDSGGVLLQPLHQQGEAVRVGDGRLLAGVPEHLGAELHVETRVSAGAAD